MGRQYNKKHGFAGYKVEKLYKVWVSMKQRCYNKNDNSYKNYGARNISVCDEWRVSYLPFREWCYENGYSLNTKLTLDRIDNNLGYSPSNCRFATRSIQNTNQRKKQLEIDGISKTTKEWASISGICPKLIIGRISRGWSEKEAVFTPRFNRGQ